MNRNHRVPSVIALGTACLLAFGCGGRNDAVVFSTKTESLPALEAQALHVNEPAFDVQLSAREAADWAGQLRTSARAVLVTASDSTNPMLRANAIEALEYAPDALDEAVRRSLADPNRGVRFVAAMMVGKQKMKQLADMVEPLRVDESGSVRAAAIYALRQCGRRADPSPLAAMLEGSSHEERGNAVMVLGELGNRSAIRMLRETAVRASTRQSPSQGRIIDLQIAEALVKLGQNAEIEVIRAGLFSPDGFGEIRALAASMLGQIGDQAYVATLHDMAVRDGDRREPAEVRMAAAMSVAMLGQAPAVANVPMEYASHTAPELRAQAAHVIGTLGDSRHLGVLRRLLDDSDPMVQVAAAGAILRLTA